MALYEDSQSDFLKSLGSVLGDAMDVVKAKYSNTKEIADVREAFETMLREGEDGFVPLAYSGGGQPLVTVLNTVVNGVAKYAFVNTAIFVGSPVFGSITNPNVKNVINLYGSMDQMVGLNMVYNNNFKGERTDLKQYNIVLEGLTHTDYFVNPEDYAQKTQQLKTLKEQLVILEQNPVLNAISIAKHKEDIGSIERMFYADAFVARLTAASKSEFRLSQFIDQINPDNKPLASVNLNEWIHGSGLTIEEIISRKKRPL